MITNSNIKILLTISFVLICIYFLCKDNLEGFQIDVAGINVLCSSVGVDCNLPSNVAHVSGESGYTCVEPSEDIKALYKFDTATCTGQTSSGTDCETNAEFIANPIEANCPTDDGCVFSGTEETSLQSDSFNVNLINDSCADQGAYMKGEIKTPANPLPPCSGPGQPYELSGCGFQCMKPARSGPEFEGNDFDWLDFPGGSDFLGGSSQSRENLHTKEFSIGKIPTTTGTGADQDVQDSRCARGYANASEICYGPDGEIAFKDDGKHIKTVDECIDYHENGSATRPPSPQLCNATNNCPMFFDRPPVGTDTEKFVGLCYNADSTDEDKMPDNNSTAYKVLGCVETCQSRNYKNQYYTYTPGGTIDSDIGLGSFIDGETQSRSGTRKHAELYQIQDSNTQEIYSAIRSPYRMDEANLYPGQVKVKEMEPTTVRGNADGSTVEVNTPCHRKTIFYSERKLNPGGTNSLVMDNATALTAQDNKYQQGYQYLSGQGNNFSYINSPSYDYSTIPPGTDTDTLGVIDKCNMVGEDVAEGEKLISFDTGYAHSDSGGTDHSRINIAGTGIASQPRDEDGYSSSACEIGQTYSVSGLFPVCPEGEECLNFNLSYAHTDKYTGLGLDRLDDGSPAPQGSRELSGIPYDLNKFKDEILGNRWLAGQLLNEGSPESISYTDEDIQNLQNSLYYFRKYPIESNDGTRDEYKINIEGQLRCDPNDESSGCYVSTNDVGGEKYKWALSDEGQTCTHACGRSDLCIEANDPAHTINEQPWPYFAGPNGEMDANLVADIVSIAEGVQSVEIKDPTSARTDQATPPIDLPLSQLGACYKRAHSGTRAADITVNATSGNTIPKIYTWNTGGNTITSGNSRGRRTAGNDNANTCDVVPMGQAIAAGSCSSAAAPNTRNICKCKVE